MTDDSTQLFDPDNGTLNPRALKDDGGESGEHVQQVTPLDDPLGNADLEHARQWAAGEYDHPGELDEDDDGAREHARTTDPSTSQRAAKGHGANATVRRGSQKHKLLIVFKVEGPLTADEACETAASEHGAKMLRAWRRVSDLINGGFLEDTGRERNSRVGRPQRVLRITNRGEAALTFFAETDRKVYRL